MPLTYDSEFQSELDTLTARIGAQNRLAWWGRLIASFAVLAGALWLLTEVGVSGDVMISAVVALSALCIIVAVNSAADAIHQTLTINIAVMEWTGRKQLGEYERPKR